MAPAAQLERCLCHLSARPSDIVFRKACSYICPYLPRDLRESSLIWVLPVCLSVRNSIQASYHWRPKPKLVPTIGCLSAVWLSSGPNSQ